MAIQQISPTAFQVALGFASALYVVVLVAFFIQRDQFPLKQRMPRFVLVELLLFSLDGIKTLVRGAFPGGTIFDFCKAHIISVIVLEEFAILMMMFRLLWISLKFYSTRTLREKVGKEAFDEPLEYPSILKKLLSHFNPIIVAGMMVLPSSILFLVQLIVTFNTPSIVNTPSTSQACFDNGLMQLNISKVVYLLPMAIVLARTIRSFLRLEDRIGLGNESRALIVLGSFFYFLQLLITIPSTFAVLQTQTRIIGFLIGIICTPGESIIQGLYPVYLSLKHENRLNRFSFKIGFHTVNASRKESTISNSTSNRTEETQFTSISEALLVRKKSGQALHEEMLLMLRDQEARGLFAAFLEKEFSLENLLFFERCQRYRTEYEEQNAHEATPEVLELAKSIYDEFVSRTASYQVNLSFAARNPLDKLFRQQQPITASHLRKETFDLARREIMLLLSRDSFSRFRETREFLNRFVS